MKTIKFIFYLELACRDNGRQAPFEKISKNPSDFIDAEYVPSDISITNPRSIKLESMIKFFKHISDREASHGISNAFRFKTVTSTRKNGVLRPARYIVDVEDPDAAEDLPEEPVRVRRKRRKDQGEGRRDPTLFLDITADVVDDTADNTTPSARHDVPTTRYTEPSARRQEPSANIHTGIFTPDETPARDISPSIPRRRQTRRPVILTPESTPRRSATPLESHTPESSTVNRRKSNRIVSHTLPKNPRKRKGKKKAD
jgi:hypothetical protein